MTSFWSCNFKSDIDNDYDSNDLQMPQQIECNPYSALTPSIQGQIKLSLGKKLNGFLLYIFLLYKEFLFWRKVLMEFSNKSDIPEQHWSYSA